MYHESYDKLARANLNEYSTISPSYSRLLLPFVQQQANLSSKDLITLHRIMVLLYNKNYEYRKYCAFPYYDFILKRYNEISKRDLQVVCLPQQYKLIENNRRQSHCSQRHQSIDVNEFCLKLANNDLYHPNMQHLCCTKCLYLNGQVQLEQVLQGKLYSEQSLKQLIKILIENRGGFIYFGIQSRRVRGQKISERNKIKIQKMIARVLMNIPGSENYDLRVEFVPIIVDQLGNEFGESLYCTRIYAQLKNQSINSFEIFKKTLFQKQDYHSCEPPHKGKQKEAYEEQVYNVFGRHEEFPILIYQNVSFGIERNLESLKNVNIEHSIYRCQEFFFIFHEKQFPSNVSKTFKKMTKFIKLNHQSQKLIYSLRQLKYFKFTLMRLKKKPQRIFYLAFQEMSHALYAYAYFNDLSNQFVNQIPAEAELMRQYYDQWTLIYKL